MYAILENVAYIRLDLQSFGDFNNMLYYYQLSFVEGDKIVKLVFAIINLDDVAAVIKHLTKNGFSSTKLTSAGGLLKDGNVTIMSGMEEERLSEALEIINKYSRSRKRLLPIPSLDGLDSPMTEVTVGGAVVFVLDCDQFLRF